MLGLTSGELIVVAFVTLAVVSATWWPRLGAAIGELLAGGARARSEASEQQDEQRMSGEE